MVIGRNLIYGCQFSCLYADDTRINLADTSDVTFSIMLSSFFTVSVLLCFFHYLSCLTLLSLSIIYYIVSGLNVRCSNLTENAVRKFDALLRQADRLFQTPFLSTCLSLSLISVRCLQAIWSQTHLRAVCSGCLFAVERRLSSFNGKWPLLKWRFDMPSQCDLFYEAQVLKV